MKIHALTLTSPDFDTLHSVALPMLETGSDVVTVLRLPAETEASFGTSSFNSICWAKITGINAALEKMDDGDVLLYTDADVMLFVTAERIVVRALEIMAETGKAMVAQHDPDTGACAGFMVIRKTPAIVALFADVNRYRSTQYNDQIILNQLARGDFALFRPDEVASHGNLVGGLWTGKPFAVPRSMFAFHLNYVVGIESKMRLAKFVAEAVKNL